MKLYEISAEIERLEQYIDEYSDEHEGEIPLDAEARLGKFEIDFHDKLEDIGRLIKNQAAFAAAVAEEIKALQAKKQRADRKAEWLRQYVAAHLGDGARFTSPSVSFSWRKSEVVEITNEAAVPAGFLKPQPPKIDKQGIKDALKAGEQYGFARLITKQNLQVK